MFSSLKRFLLATHFVLAFAIGYVPAWGQSSSQTSVQTSISDDGAVAVICPGLFRKSIEPWVNYRMNQGYKVYLLEEPKNEPLIEKTSEGRVYSITPSVTPEYVKSRIKELAETDPTLKYLLIIGDGAPDVNSEPTAASRLIPAPHVKANVVSLFGRREKEIASDNYYADLNDDSVPELAVGRISVSRPEELDLIVKKIISYETNSDQTFWKRRLNFVAGVGGFSPLLDGVIESSVRYILSEMISEGYDLSFTQANWRSPFCPAPELFRSVTVERFNEGCLFWVYMGHGYHKALDTLHTPQGDFPIFVEGDAQYIESRSGLPIAIFCACHTGAFDGVENCVAEDLLRQPGGPIAVIASSRVSMPYGMAVFGVEFIENAMSGNCENIGTIFLNAKRNMLVKQKGNNKKGDNKKTVRSMIDSIARLTDPLASQLNDQLVDHLHLFHLFGDPLLKIPLPEEVKITCPDVAAPGEVIKVTGKAAFDGPIYLELVTPRKRLSLKAAGRNTFESNEKTRAEYMQAYRAANNLAILYVSGRSDGGVFEVPLKIPEDLEGEYVLRCFSAHDAGVAIGSGTIKIVPPSTASTK